MTREQRRWRKTGLLVAFFAHLLIGLLVLPQIPYTWDIIDFHSAAVSILNGESPQAASSVSSFATFQAIVYAVLFPDPTSLTIVNSVLAVLVPFPVVYLAERLYSSVLRSTDGLFVLVLFAPSPFFFMTIPMRDTFAILLFFILLALTTKFLLENSYYLGLSLLPLHGAMFYIRTELAIISLLSAGAALTLQALDRTTDKEIKFSTLLGLLSVPSTLAVLFFARWIPLSELNRRVQYRSSGGAAYLDDMIYNSEYEVLLISPIRAIYFQFAPFPAHVNAIFDLAVASMLPLLILLAISAYRSLIQVEADRSVTVFLVLVYVSGVIGYGLVDSNFGTTARHRIPFTFLLAVFAAPTIQRWKLLLVQWLGESPRKECQEKEHEKKAKKTN